METSNEQHTINDTDEKPPDTGLGNVKTEEEIQITNKENTDVNAELPTNKSENENTKTNQEEQKKAVKEDPPTKEIIPDNETTKVSVDDTEKSGEKYSPCKESKTKGTNKNDIGMEEVIVTVDGVQSKTEEKVITNGVMAEDGSTSEDGDQPDGEDTADDETKSIDDGREGEKTGDKAGKYVLYIFHGIIIGSKIIKQILHDHNHKKLFYTRD